MFKEMLTLKSTITIVLDKLMFQFINFKIYTG